MDKQTLSNRIKRAIRAAGLNNHQVAIRLDLDGMAVHRWASGVTRPRQDNLTRLSALLGVPVEYFTDSDTPDDLPDNTDLLDRYWRHRERTDTPRHDDLDLITAILNEKLKALNAVTQSLNDPKHRDALALALVPFAEFDVQLFLSDLS